MIVLSYVLIRAHSNSVSVYFIHSPSKRRKHFFNSLRLSISNSSRIQRDSAIDEKAQFKLISNYCSVHFFLSMPDYSAVSNVFLQVNISNTSQMFRTVAENQRQYIFWSSIYYKYFLLFFFLCCCYFLFLKKEMTIFLHAIMLWANWEAWARSGEAHSIESLQKCFDTTEQSFKSKWWSESIQSVRRLSAGTDRALWPHKL